MPTSPKPKKGDLQRVFNVYSKMEAPAMKILALTHVLMTTSTMKRKTMNLKTSMLPTM